MEERSSEKECQELPTEGGRLIFLGKKTPSGRRSMCSYSISAISTEGVYTLTAVKNADPQNQEELKELVVYSAAIDVISCLGVLPVLPQKMCMVESVLRELVDLNHAMISPSMSTSNQPASPIVAATKTAFKNALKPQVRGTPFDRPMNSLRTHLDALWNGGQSQPLASGMIDQVNSLILSLTITPDWFGEKEYQELVSFNEDLVRFNNQAQPVDQSALFTVLRRLNELLGSWYKKINFNEDLVRFNNQAQPVDQSALFTVLRRLNELLGSWYKKINAR